LDSRHDDAGWSAVSRFVAILAGGSGTRLWPLSRADWPKQLLALLGDRSLVQATVDRVAPLVGPERTLVVTEASHADQLREQLPELPAENILVEPTRRGTAAAVGLGAVTIAARDPGATMASLHSDAAVVDGDEFRACLTASFELAESDDWLVTMGVRPTSPHTGMGYIEVVPEIGTYNGRVAHEALRFVEKPSRETAERFIEQGFVWNPGMFVWRTSVVLQEFARWLPAISAGLREIGDAIATPGAMETLRSVYPRIPVETIDFGIMERADRVATIPASFGWSDVGSWGELYLIAPKDDAGNVVRGQHVGIDTQGVLLHGADRPVFTIGVHDLVIVDLPDALLICSRAEAERVKALVEQLQADGSWKHLT
jgi:mannose-1-phosphate guanylyltransferase